MAKAVFSLILDEDVVAEIDKIAYKKGVSRSALINDVLANNVKVQTPEMRFASVFNMMEEFFGTDGNLTFVNQPSAFMASVKGMISYRYNPTVKYSVELYPEGDFLGELKISFRTQNATLLALTDVFFESFYQLERSYLSKELITSYGGGRMVRRLRIPKNSNGARDVADAINGFIKSIDNLLRTYFSYLSSPSLGRILEETYLKNLDALTKV